MKFVVMTKDSSLKTFFFFIVRFPQYMEPYVHIPEALLQEEYIPTIINVEIYTCDVLLEEYIRIIIPSIM